MKNLCPTKILTCVNNYTPPPSIFPVAQPRLVDAEQRNQKNALHTLQQQQINNVNKTEKNKKTKRGTKKYVQGIFPFNDKKTGNWRKTKFTHSLPITVHVKSIHFPSATTPTLYL
jgi:hypothetical protein